MLTVRFGARRPYGNYIPDDDDAYDPTYSEPYVPREDICPDNPVFCDAAMDCQLGSDETNCGEEEEEAQAPNKNTKHWKKCRQKSIVDGRW